MRLGSQAKVSVATCRKIEPVGLNSNIFHIMRVVLFTILAFMLLIAACTKESDLQESSFHYPDPVTLSKAGFVSEAGEHLFGSPGSVLPLSGGEFIVADNQSLLLHLFDQDLTYLHTFGGRGNGPGEFQRFNDISVRESSITVYDGSRSIISEIKAEGGRLSMAGTHDFTYTGHPDHPGAMFWRFTEGENGSNTALYYDFNIMSEEQPRYHRIVLFPYDENYQPASEDPVAVFQFSAELNANDNIVLQVPFISRGLISSLDGRILHAVNDEPVIKIYDHNGNHIDSIELPDTSTELTRNEKTKAYDQMYANSPDPDRFRSDVMKHIPEKRPVIRSLLTDADKRIWVRIFTNDEAPDQIVFDQEGSPVKKLSLPEGYSFRNASGNRVFAQRNSDDGPEIVVFELEME